jgi:hypothetical protein
MNMEITPKVESVLLSTLKPGVFVYFNGRKAFTCHPEKDPKITLAVYNPEPRRFEYRYTAADPTVVTLVGDYALHTDLDPTIQDAQMGLNSGAELYIANGSKPRIVVFIEGVPDWCGVLDMQEWIVREGAGMTLPRIPRWKFGLKLTDGTTSWQLDISPAPKPATVKPLNV